MSGQDIRAIAFQIAREISDREVWNGRVMVLAMAGVFDQDPGAKVVPGPEDDAGCLRLEPAAALRLLKSDQGYSCNVSNWILTMTPSVHAQCQYLCRSASEGFGPCKELPQRASGPRGSGQSGLVRLPLPLQVSRGDPKGPLTAGAAVARLR